MNRSTASGVLLRAPASESFIPLAVSFAEKGALGLGLNKDEALRLTLAVEEVFTYLCRTAAPDHVIEISCVGGSHYVSLVFTVPTEAFQLRAFNLTTPVSLQDEAGLDEIGLVLAARLVDRFRMNRARHEIFTLTLIIEKSYPALVPDVSLPVQRVSSFSVREPHAEELKLAVHLISSYYQAEILPVFFSYPGKVVDMSTGGDLHAAVAIGPSGTMVGAILWQRLGDTTVECFGPYVFGQEPGMGIREELLNACLHTLARSRVVALINRFPTHDFPHAQFELLGSFSLHTRDGSLKESKAWFRLLREDPGCTVWSHPDVQPFLQSEYRRLVLPRNIQPVTSEGEEQVAYSVISADVDRLQGQATLQPAWPGRDMQENVSRHLQLLLDEGLHSVFFLLDLSQAWQAAFAGALRPNGFEPCLILPYAGEGDLLVFQFKGPTP
jgi:anti-sigma regulatory factor (Ser/Thr protein kinase)